MDVYGNSMVQTVTEAIWKRIVWVFAAATALSYLEQAAVGIVICSGWERQQEKGRWFHSPLQES
ncbi:MAG: hypothetical protein Q4C91_05670 [Eubacteriales bacterium]|nr:hypothetical protein [Eubacteriales bacterium]